MENILHFLQINLPWLISYKYLFLFLGSFIEGLNTMVFGGFLASLNAVNLWLVLLIMLVGHTLNGYVWYAVGFWGGAKSLDKWGHREKLSHDVIEKVTDYFNRYSGRTIMITKLTFSLQIAALIMAGSLKYNLKQFTKYNFYGSLGWTLLTVFVGYFFGESFEALRLFLKNFTYFIIFLGGAMALVIIFKIVMKSKFIRLIKLDAKLREINGIIKEKLDQVLSNKDQ
ncbi:MAG: DedA family protein [Parcubacteria group bacterium]|nr:DedA family protein [Parcubacteria group bacterium]